MIGSSEPTWMNENLKPELWTPSELTYLGPRYVGTSGDNERVYNHVFEVKWKGRTRTIAVIGEESTSIAHLEDMAAAACERGIREIAIRLQEKDGKIAYGDLDQSTKDDVAEAMRSIHEWLDRRKANPFSQKYY